jgi:hypothetical protein
MPDIQTKDNQALPPEPEKPLRDDCCGGGSCCPCIWDIYYEKLAKWREAKAALETSQDVPFDKT